MALDPKHNINKEQSVYLSTMRAEAREHALSYYSPHSSRSLFLRSNYIYVW